MPKVDKWRLCWDYNKDAKAIIQSTLTNVVPFCEQMGPRVWVGKQAEYPSPSWLEETRINGKQGYCQDSLILHVIFCQSVSLRQKHEFCCLTVNPTNTIIPRNTCLFRAIYIYSKFSTVSGLLTAVVINFMCTLKSQFIMLTGPQLSVCSSVNQHQPMAWDWAEHFGFSYLIMRVLNAVCCELGQNKLTRGSNKGCFPSWKRIRIACHSAGSCGAEALLKKSFRELRCPQLGLRSGKKTTC